MDTTLPDLFSGIVPKRIIIRFISNAAFNGTYTTNPFNFKHFSMSFFTLYVDGTAVPSKPLQPDFDSKLYMQAYSTLFTGSGIYYSNQGDDISLAEYPNGYTLLVFDLTPDSSASAAFHTSPQRQGSVRLEVHFNTVLPTPVTATIYGEFSSEVEIDFQRKYIYC